MNQEAQSNQINSILAKCWADESFKQKLLADPATTLKAEGVEIPAGYTVRVLEHTDKVLHYILPPNPNAELSDSELESVAGGKGIPYMTLSNIHSGVDDRLNDKSILGSGGHGVLKHPSAK